MDLNLKENIERAGGMKFQKKIILVYMIFSVVITGAFGCIYYKLSVEQYKSKEYGNLHTVSSVKLQQMEDVLESMDAAITYFLSDIETVSYTHLDVYKRQA